MSNLILEETANMMKRSGWRTVALILVMTVTLLCLGFLLTFFSVTRSIADYIIQNPEVIGFFKDDATEEQILAIKQDIETKSNVVSVSYVSRSDAMKIFIEENKNDQDLISAVDANIFPASLNVRVNNFDTIESVKSYLHAQQQIFQVVSYDQEGIEYLKKRVYALQIVGLVLLMVFTVMTSFIIFLSIGLAVYSKKKEIIVLKLVGATNWFVRAPYILQSVLFSIVATGLTSLILIPGLWYFYDDIMRFIIGDLNVVTLSPVSLGLGFLILLGFALFMSFFSSLLATRRYIDS